ncbi:hydrogenase-4 component B [Escherichia coli]|uniref:Hydrogenase-4 component B n=1 Tax=Escherichia coli TaxID=562 RepID=A0A376KT83_ECOLX|nr:hydrogenase-4 component B [Escherichia coli]
MPDWLPRDISHSSAEWFYQRMVHLAVAVLTKSCGSRSATTCGSYCYGNAGSHWWAGSNVLRKNVRYYFCGAPRSTHAEEAQEVPNTMIVAMLLLAALCVLIALSASWLAPKIMHIAHAFTNTPPVTVASGIALVPGTFHTRVTPHYYCCYYWRCLCCLAFTGCGVVRAAQRFVAQEMPGHAATAGKMRWPRQAMA